MTLIREQWLLYIHTYIIGFISRDSNGFSIIKSLITLCVSLVRYVLEYGSIGYDYHTKIVL